MIDDGMEQADAQELAPDAGVELFPGRKLTDDADAIVHLYDKTNIVQYLLNSLFIYHTYVRDALYSCEGKSPFQEFVGSSIQHILEGEQQKVVDRFIHLGRCITNSEYYDGYNNLN